MMVHVVSHEVIMSPAQMIRHTQEVRGERLKVVVWMMKEMSWYLSISPTALQADFSLG